ncbi:1204_t:CDS:2 [Paraglomus occultum]|uniref:1204_t:CDS:1 n=1 Tax=Paraglomus occultum TaxID=144539 RepID=A0A9N8W5W2_9GLOM|nr:1204_t:CDS:2 [Paraglomus occultum]
MLEKYLGVKDGSQDTNEGFKTITGPEISKSVKITGAQADQKISPHDIDAFWLQRLIANYYSDPHTA